MDSLPPGLATRPMRPEETDLLLRRFRAPASRVLRVLGALLGLGAAFLAFSFLAGFPYDPSVIVWEILVLGVVSAALAGAGASGVRDVRAAIESGRVVEETGLLLPSEEAPRGVAAFRLGRLMLQLPRSVGSELSANQPQQVCIAVGLRSLGNRSAPGLFSDRGLLLSANGAARARPVVVYLRSTGTDSPPGSGASSAFSGGFVTTPTAAGPPVGGPDPNRSAGVFCDRCGGVNAFGFLFCRHCGVARVPVEGS